MAPPEPDRGHESSPASPESAGGAEVALLRRELEEPPEDCDRGDADLRTDVPGASSDRSHALADARALRRGVDRGGGRREDGRDGFLNREIEIDQEDDSRWIREEDAEHLGGSKEDGG